MNIEKIKLIISEGEGLTVEFKEKSSPKIDRDIVAFANTKGGQIMLGVSDDGRLIGETLTKKMKAEILSIARNCEPNITISKINQIGNVVIIEVAEGDDKPYSCSSGYYRRLDAITQKMTQKEIGLLFKHAQQVSFEERICRGITWNDISTEKIAAFFREAGINTGTIIPQNVLTSLKLADRDGIKNAGTLFFARDPQRFILHCETILVSFKGTHRVDIIDRKDLRDDLWMQYQEAMIFLKRHLSVRTEIKGLDRKDIYEIPLEALREAVANALIHRDYTMRGTSIMVEVHEDKVIIKNPGGFPDGMSSDKLGFLSVRRNELIADIFARMHRVERMGSGFRRIREYMESAGLPFPKITSDKFFFIEFERPVKTQKTTQETTQEKICGLIKNNPSITREQMAEQLGITTDGVKYHLDMLRKEGRIRHVGATKKGRWVLLEPK